MSYRVTVASFAAARDGERCVTSARAGAKETKSESGSFQCRYNQGLLVVRKSFVCLSFTKERRGWETKHFVGMALIDTHCIFSKAMSSSLELLLKSSCDQSIKFCFSAVFFLINFLQV